MINFHDMWRPKSSGNGKAVATGIFSALAAAVVTYFLYGTKKGARKREKMKRWAKDMKNNVSDSLGDDDSVEVVTETSE